MGIPSWIWFVVAVVAIALGSALLAADRRQRSGNNRERRRWAALRGWQFAESDRVLPTRWERGALARHSAVEAVDIVAGSTFTSDGRRQVYVLDLQVGGRTADVLVAVRCRRPVPVTAELWLPEVPVPQDSGLDLLGPVGSRYAFVGDVVAARRTMTPSVVDAADQLGSDVTVTWFEGDWVLAALDPAQDESGRIERLLRDLGELADAVDPFDRDPNDPVEPVADTTEQEVLAEAEAEAAGEADEEAEAEVASIDPTAELDDEESAEKTGSTSSSSSASSSARTSGQVDE